MMVDAVLFRAGFMTMGRVLTGFGEQVRAAALAGSGPIAGSHSQPPGQNPAGQWALP
jgi:hypothetical protein